MKKEHLPIIGVGPIYVIVIAILTALSIYCNSLSIFVGGKITILRTLLYIVGVCMIAIGVYIWIQAVIVSKLDENIKKNHLVTDGIYAWVRNPVYSAFMIAFTGILLMLGNIYFFVLPLVFWMFMTILMICTEEKWLKKEYGSEYLKYCLRVNRCWPWFPKSK